YRCKAEGAGKNPRKLKRNNHAWFCFITDDTGVPVRSRLAALRRTPWRLSPAGGDAALAGRRAEESVAARAGRRVLRRRQRGADAVHDVPSWRAGGRDRDGGGD